MRIAAGMLVAVIAAATYPSSAQYPPRGPYPQQEECPQGRQLRQQKSFPPQMTDCQVLDADTAEQRRLRRQPDPVPVQAAPVQPAAAQPEWKRFDADNGAAFRVDLNSITNLGNGSVLAIVYIEEAREFQPQNMRRFWVDCQDHYYRDETSAIGPKLYAPPRSVAASMAEAICNRATSQPRN